MARRRGGPPGPIPVSLQEVVMEQGLQSGSEPVPVTAQEPQPVLGEQRRGQRGHPARVTTAMRRETERPAAAMPELPGPEVAELAAAGPGVA